MFSGIVALGQALASIHTIKAMESEAIERVRILESELLCRPQAPIHTEHVLHGGLYSRTVLIPAGACITGAHIKVPTLLIISGHVTVAIGSAAHEFTGYNVLPASAGRKQAFFAHTDTQLTMVFTTKATTVAQAEDEFTDEAHLLLSRQQPGLDSITITGEQSCQE